MTILDELAQYALFRVAEDEKKMPKSELVRLAMAQKKGDFEFEKALSGKGLKFICECKKASPSKGLICENFDYMSIAKQYQAAGADCISVLTEPKWFLGSDKYLEEISRAVTIPTLRKDFTVDDYMIYSAKLLGAKSILLICSILEKAKISDYLQIADGLGMSALVEAHDEWEVETALAVGARIVGVNNRNLKDFSVDTQNSLKLRQIIPKDVLFVSESGIKSREDIIKIQNMGANAVLIGETLMNAQDKTKALSELKGEL